jgi:hypothetical protein
MVDCTDRNLKRDFKRARELVRNCDDRIEFARLLGVTDRTLRRIASSTDPYDISARLLYDILVYGPALQKRATAPHSAVQQATAEVA